INFFFQAEDGIRDRNVTGVQTCALPIYEIPLQSLYTLEQSSYFPHRYRILLKLFQVLEKIYLGLKYARSHNKYLYLLFSVKIVLLCVKFRLFALSSLEFL